MKIKRSGFTLIELLIVVAIIAILAAIAVPNFLEAQTRAKVSRTKNDHRTYATAIEAYHVDTNCYPTNISVTNADFDSPLKRLSTPIAYMTDGWLEDPFGNSQFLGSGGKAHYFYVPLNKCDPVVAFALQLNLISRLALSEPLEWEVVGAGPDRIYEYQICRLTMSVIACLSSGNEDILQGRGLYDPTNGTVSFGDLRRNGKGIQTSYYNLP